MLTPRQAAKMQVASITALIELLLPYVLGLPLKMRQSAVFRISPNFWWGLGLYTLPRYDSKSPHLNYT
jgi:hypothetical protein